MEKQHFYEPETFRGKIEQVMLQVEKLGTVGDNLTPNEPVARFHSAGNLNDKMTFDAELRIDADVLKQMQQERGVHSAWNYNSAVINLATNKGKDQYQIQANHGFVATGAGTYYHGRMHGKDKSVDATTEIAVKSSQYIEGEKDMLSTDLNENGKWVTVYHHASEEPENVVNNLYYAFNPKQKASLYERLTNFKEKFSQGPEREM